MASGLPLVCILLSGALAWRRCAAALRVDLSPGGPLFRLGERQQLTCSVHDCPVTPAISWTPLGDRPLNAGVRTRDRLSLLTFDPVEMEHEGPLLCKVICGDQHKHAKTDIRLYAFPSDPEIRGHDHVRAGEESTLTCKVRDLYPAEMLTLDWLRGGQVVRSVVGEAGATSVQSAYTFTPQRAESAENLTCRATLDLQDLAPPERTRQTVARLHVTFAPVVTALSDPGAVMSGSVLVLRCSASGNPVPVLTWTFRPEGGGSAQVKGHGEELVLAAQAGEFQCEARNREGKHSEAVRLRVNAAPSNTSISVSPGQEVVEGQRVTFSCRSRGAPPPDLVLSREGVELWRSDSTPSLTFSLSVRPQDSASYRCDATNAFGTQHVTRNVTVEAHPLLVEVSPQVALAGVSSGLVLTCASSGCSGPPALTWRRTEPEGGVPPSAAGSRLLLRDLRPQDGGGYVCRATCGNVTRSARATVHVYSLPSDPVLKDGGAVPLGQEARLQCEVRDVFPAERLRLRWWSGNVSLLVQTFGPSPSPRNISAVLRHRAEAGRRLVSCEARLLTEAGAVWRSRKSSLLLRVHYPPTGTSVTVSPAQDVLEGQRVTVTCRSDAAPPPTVILRREGAELRRSASSLSYSLTARLPDSALYLCHASNALGSQEVARQVTVTAPPRNTTVTVAPSASVSAGQNVTVSCRSVGFPPPDVVLEKAADGSRRRSADGIFRLVDVTARDSGLYRVNASNRLGYQVRVFQLSVTEPGAETPPALATILVPAAIGAAGLAAAALVVDYLRRSKKKGSYQLTACAPAPERHLTLSSTCT